MMAIMSRIEYQKSVARDPLNVTHERNRRNTPLSAYNCGGLALGVFDWVTPYITTGNTNFRIDGLYTDDEREVLIHTLYERDWSVEDIEAEITRRDVDYLLEEYPFLEEVNLEDCDPDEMVIAYRMFVRFDDDIGEIEDTDFHFKVRYHGFWFEKMGSENITTCELKPDEVWQYRDEYTRYTGPIVYFRTRRTVL